MHSVATLSRLIGAAIFALTALPALAQQATDGGETARRSTTAEEGCALRKGARRSVTAIIDAETVKLDDGSVVRLVGALAPSAIDGGQANGHWPLEVEARAFLQSMILGKTVQLAHADTDDDSNEDESRRKRAQRHPRATRDRHGHILAHLFLGDDANTNVWVQAALLRAGLARAYVLPGHEACLREMMLHEATARQTRLGLWSNRLYRIKRAEPGRGLMRFRNRFELVRGVVANVTVTRSATYINFGADWRRDFTIRIDKALRAKHPEWSNVLTALKGKTVTVRGWIERRNGPEIRLWSPDQIEIATENEASERSASSHRRSVPEFESGDDARGIDPPKTKPARPNIDSNAPAEFDL